MPQINEFSWFIFSSKFFLIFFLLYLYFFFKNFISMSTPYNYLNSYYFFSFLI